MLLSHFYLQSISAEARAFLEQLPAHEDRPLPPQDDDASAWRDFQEMIETRMQPFCDAASEKYDAKISKTAAGPLEALFVSPHSVPDGNTPAIYIHGGGYTGFSAYSSLSATIPLSAELDAPLISVDYPLAPHSTVNETVLVTTNAIASLLEQYPQAPIIGESAGGGLALSAINRLLLRDVRPQCLALISPWTDLGNRGESRETMAAFDPILQYEPGLRRCAELYAGATLDSPDASPVFADYSADFPSTLILCGSREILLSDSLRLHRKLVASGADAVLGVYDGMFHSFPVIAPEIPESSEARKRIRLHFAESSSQA